MGSIQRAKASLDLDQVLEAVRPVVHYENEQGFKSEVPYFLSCPEVLHATGVIEDLQREPLVIEKDGKEQTVWLQAAKLMLKQDNTEPPFEPELVAELIAAMKAENARAGVEYDAVRPALEQFEKRGILTTGRRSIAIRRPELLRQRIY